MLGTLAAAYAESGQFPKAVAAAEEAHDLATAQNESKLAKELTERLKAYRAGSLYRESHVAPAASTKQP
jgi:hypothetical protein